jgi:uncharacterized protein YggE
MNSRFSRRGHPMFQSRARLAAACTLFLAGWAATPAPADDQPAGIAVTGTGTAKVKATSLEITGTISGDAELAADSQVKFRDTRKKAVDLLEAMKMPGLTISGDGETMHDYLDPMQQMRIMQGGGGDAVKPKVQVTEKLHLTITAIHQRPPDKVQGMVVKLLDTARQTGLQIGTPPPTNYYAYRMSTGQNDELVLFKIADPAAGRSEAFKQAVADARGKADQLATLAGAKLGKVIAITEQESSGPSANEQSMQQMMQLYTGMSMAGEKTPDAAAGDLIVKVRLSVRYELAQ